MKSFDNDEQLLAEYVAAFGILDDLENYDEFGGARRQPQKVATAPFALTNLYSGLGLTGVGSSRFPTLYETLLLSYRWGGVELDHYCLFANEPGEDFAPLLSAIRRDKSLSETLEANGYIPFGQVADRYDPLCFDLRQQQKEGDCRIVRIDHEAILCRGRIGEITEIAHSFRSLVLHTINRVATKESLLFHEED